MNRTGIEWCDYSWNPLTGCDGNCPYCYAKKMAYRLRGRYGYPEDEPFRPTFHPERLKEPYELQKPSKIFVSSMGDLFGESVCNDWIERVISVAHLNPRHIFIFLTKNPKRYADFSFSKNCWLGYSTTGSLYHDWEYHNARNKHFVSIEPIAGLIKAYDFLVNLDWIILGAETGNRKGKIVPKREWIESVIDFADKNRIPLFMKDNLGGLKEGFERRQEFPEVSA